MDEAIKVLRIVEEAREKALTDPTVDVHLKAVGLG